MLRSSAADAWQHMLKVGWRRCAAPADRCRFACWCVSSRAGRTSCVQRLLWLGLRDAFKVVIKSTQTRGRTSFVASAQRAPRVVGVRASCEAPLLRRRQGFPLRTGRRGCVLGCTALRSAAGWRGLFCQRSTSRCLQSLCSASPWWIPGPSIWTLAPSRRKRLSCGREGWIAALAAESTGLSNGCVVPGDPQDRSTDGCSPSAAPDGPEDSALLQMVLQQLNPCGCKHFWPLSDPGSSGPVIAEMVCASAGESQRKSPTTGRKFDFNQLFFPKRDRSNVVILKNLKGSKISGE